MRKHLYTLSILLAFCFSIVGMSKGLHGKRGRSFYERTSGGVIYHNPEYYLFDSLYGNNNNNTYGNSTYDFKLNYNYNYGSYYPNFGWGYNSWFGFGPRYRNWNRVTDLSIGIGFSNSWFPGFLWY